MSLPYQNSEHGWCVCKVDYKASVAIGLLLGDSAQLGFEQANQMFNVRNQ
jgi:hypothetical protein